MNIIAKPGEVEIRQVSKNGPLVEPCVVRMEMPGVIQFVTLGGLTKVEALAGQIVGHLCASDTFQICAGMNDKQFAVRVACRATNFAEAILAECQARAKEKQENQK